MVWVGRAYVCATSAVLLPAHTNLQLTKEDHALLSLEEYFNQDQYFSESSNEFKGMEEMPFPYAYNAFMKLVETHGRVFYGTTLHSTFLKYLHPNPASIRENLKINGRVAIVPEMRITDKNFHQADVRARMKVTSVAKGMGQKVTTHWNGKWVEVELKTSPVKISVKGETYES